MNMINSKEISGMEKSYRTNLINSLNGYKSLHLLGTVNEFGVTNLCIVSSVFHMGSNPPLFGMIIRPEREHNDTLKNIKSSKQYTLNNVLPEWYKKAHQTSASYPAGESEFESCDFEASYTEGFKAPFVTESSVKLGLELRQLTPMDINGTTLVIGEVIHIDAAQELVAPDGFLDHYSAGTVTSTGLDSYYQTKPLGRLSYAKPGITPKEM
jgi:flavin reductase (DIM6/NTAB) family NADH-FMN oxidoreductase RutF